MMVNCKVPRRVISAIWMLWTMTVVRAPVRVGETVDEGPDRLRVKTTVIAVVIIMVVWVTPQTATKPSSSHLVVY